MLYKALDFDELDTQQTCLKYSGKRVHLLFLLHLEAMSK